MKDIARRRPSPAMVVALIALFVALGGTVYAAGKINGKTIKPGTLPGNRLKGESVTGAQVSEGSLGKVPSADTLDGIDSTQLLDAETLDGIDSAEFLQAADAAFARVARDGTGDDAISAHFGSGTAAEAAISAPREGFLLAIASAAVHNSADDDAYTCILNLNGTDFGPSRRGGELPTPGIPPLNEEVCATNAVFPVQPGLSLVRLNFSDLDDTTVVDEAELDLVFIPLALD